MNKCLRFITKLLLKSYLFSEAPEFSPGKTYEYKYEAHLLGGLPEEGLARAGVKIESRVWISPIAPDTFIMKVRSFSKCEQNFMKDKPEFCSYLTSFNEHIFCSW